jgi:hypothetical protein
MNLYIVLCINIKNKILKIKMFIILSCFQEKKTVYRANPGRTRSNAYEMNIFPSGIPYERKYFQI